MSDFELLSIVEFYTTEC